MIQLTCANCRNTLEVDDAFAGGVCRCQHCGTIQTVPKPGARPRNPGSPNASPAAAEEPKALYQVKSRTGMSSAPSGLEELAEVVHSSGLSSGLAHRSTRNITTASPAQQKAASRSMLIAFVIGFGIITVISVIVVMFVFFKSNPADSSAPPTGLAALPTSPSFYKTDLSADKVIYCIDRGSATANYFNLIKTLTSKSVQSLGGDRRFAVILWNNGSDDAYPRSGSSFATPDEVDKLKKWFDDVPTGRATSIDSAIKAAAEQSPGEIVILTAKSDQLEGSDFAAVVLNAVKGKTIAVHTFTLGDSPAGDPLKRIALDTKGKFTHIKPADIANINQ